MQCAHPVWIQRPDGLRREVPCGNCSLCRIARAREWAVRCLHERAVNSSAAFCTLTYRPDKLPQDFSVSKYDMQTFLKRLRERHEGKIRYFLSGEYGEENGRPHYHALLFGLRPCSCGIPDARQNDHCGCHDRDMVLETWGKGGVAALGTVTYKSARYCASYVSKAQLYDWKNDLRTRPFILYSKGLGRDYADQNKNMLVENGELTVNGAQVGIPRYYAKRLGIKHQVMEEEIKLDELPVASKIAHVWVGPATEQIFSNEAPRKQRGIEEEARQRAWKKGRL